MAYEKEHINMLLDMKLKGRGLKKKDFKFKVIEQRRYNEGKVVYTWVECEVNGTSYRIGDPYEGKRTTRIRDLLILSTLFLMDEDEK